MTNIENAVRDTIEELELEEHIEYDIREVEQDRVYHVTFQEIRNGNNRVVISVEYSTEIGDLLDDESWEGDVAVEIVRREGMGPTTAEVILELLAITLDDNYFDSEDESDDETLSLPSEPRTPPPRSYRPLVPRLQLPQRDLP